MEIKDFIKIYDNTIHPETIGRIIKFSKRCEFKAAAIAGDMKTDKIQKIDESIRKVHGFSFRRGSKSMSEVHWGHFLSNHFTNMLQRYAKDINPKWGLPDLPVFQLLNIDLLRYENTGHYKYHHDAGSVGEFRRNISIIMLLNNDYEGGQLCFRNPDETGEFCIDPVPGRIILWPSIFMYPHTVKPVTKGTRYSIVSWSS